VRKGIPGSAYLDPERFEPFERRARRADNLTTEVWDAVQSAKKHLNGKAGMSWRGVPLRKNPWDMTLYPMLMWELQPRTIIELGAAEGGSVLWIADIADAFHLNARIISVDNNLAGLHARDPRVEYVEFDMFDIDFDPFPVAVEELPHPWLLIEDTHKNIVPVLEYFDPHIIRGDYLIVEDTLAPPTHDELDQFMKKHGSRYRVDTHYVDNFGYNNTWNWNSFLACVENPVAAK
jgi:cephalosporin hydroxylase